jgi:hypothetical protein
MKVLVIETTPATPHAETSIEIAIKESLAGSHVVYCPIFHILPLSLWRSNINGRKNDGKIDSLQDWLNYLVVTVSMYAEVDVFELSPMPDYLTEDVKNNLLSFLHDGHNLGNLVKSNATEIFQTENINLIDNFNHINICLKLAQTAILAYELALMLVKKHKPDLVVFFNGRTPGSFPIFLVCKKLKIPICVHERGSAKDYYSLWDTPPQYLYEYRNKINRYSSSRSAVEARCSAAVFYFRQRHSKLTSFGPLVNKSKNPDAEINLDGLCQRYITYFTSSSWEIMSMPMQDYKNRLGSQCEAVAALARVCATEGFQLVIRMHPNTPDAEINNYIKYSEQKGCLVVFPKDIVSSYRLGAESFRNFSFGSTITWEFMYCGIPCATLGKSVGSGEVGVIELDNVESIRDYIRKDLTPIDKAFPIKYGDFTQNHGERYDFYNANTLFSGHFDVELSEAF